MSAEEFESLVNPSHMQKHSRVLDYPNVVTEGIRKHAPNMQKSRPEVIKRERLFHVQYRKRNEEIKRNNFLEIALVGREIKEPNPIQG